MLDIEWNEWGTEKSLPSLERFIAAGGDVNIVDPVSGYSLLWLATEQMDIPLILRLGELGVDPNYKQEITGLTAVHNAIDIDIDSVKQCEQPSSKDQLLALVTFSVTEAIVRIGGSLYERGAEGNTPFDDACEYDQRLGAKLLSVVDGTPPTVT